METFEFTNSIKKALFWMMGAGVLGLALVFLSSPENNHARFWTNILENVYYFTGIGLFGLFAVAAGQLAYGSWQILTKRIFLSLSAFSVLGGFLLLAIVLLGFAHVHSLYDRVFHILTLNPVPAKYTTKVVYFAPVFWIGRLVFYAVIWAAFSIYMNKFFARTDQLDPKVYKHSKLLAAAFIVVFAVTESSVSWDMIMSLDPSWYSTLFGWYNFASYGCAAWAVTILIVIFLKSQGYLQKVNENHVHDLGKLLFGFSIFWTYLWFDQFMLQWYANIPEDTHFWVQRFNDGYFKGAIFVALVINFVFPLIFLIQRGAKRNFRVIGFGAALLVFGHYIDFFTYTFFEPNKNAEAQAHHHAQNNTAGTILYAEASKGQHGTADAAPATGHDQADATHRTNKEAAAPAPHGKHGETAPVSNFASIGLGEILVFIGFFGLFLYLFFLNLAKRPIVVENDPYLKESERIVVTYS